MRKMSFKTTILLSKIAILLIVIFSLSLTYIYYKNEFLKDMQERIEEEILFHKKNIIFPLQRASNMLKVKQEVFKKIHQNALQILKKSPNSNLQALKIELEKKYNLPFTEINIFLINKSNIIYDTTFKQDLHFNLSRSANISRILNAAKQDGKIHFLKRIVTDIADMRYKTYSYSKISDDTFLELSFSDKSIQNIFTQDIHNIKNKNVDIKIYNIARIKDDFFYFPLAIKEHNISKNNYYKELKKFQKDRPNNDKIMETFFSNKRIIEENDDTYTVYTKLYEAPLDKSYIFQNVVVRFDIKHAKKQQFLHSIQTIFLITLLASCIILLLIFFAIKNKLIKPINIITQSIKETHEIPLKGFENKKSEFFSIAKEYNELYKRLKKEIKKNRNITYIDYLTKVNNRKSFDKRLEELLNAKKRYLNAFSIMLFDIDDFKKINDTFGHQKGDEVLIDMANLVTNTIRKSDYLFRLGGEEFAILFPETDLKSSLIIANKIKNLIEQEFEEVREGSITISGGVYEVNIDDTSDSIYKKADSLLYIAKNKGKNKIIS